MVFKKFTDRLRRSKSTPFAAKDWDIQRARQVTSDLQEMIHAEPFHGISWIAMACFVEEVDPHALALSREDVRAAISGLERLRAMKPLEAYAGCLERLSAAINEADGELSGEQEDVERKE